MQDTKMSVKERREGVTYQTGVGLLAMPVINETIVVSALPPPNAQLVYFATETSGFAKNADILQIAVKSGDSMFNVYINPTQQIAAKASEVHGFTNVGGELHHNGVRLPTVPLLAALKSLHKFLSDLGKPCILVAHSARFDAPCLMRAIQEHALLEEFTSLLHGFSDSLTVLREALPQRKGKGMFKQTTLAEDFLQKTAEGAHNAANDVCTLEEIVKAVGIQEGQLIQGSVCVAAILGKGAQAERTAEALKTLSPLEGVLSLHMRSKMAKEGICFEHLITTFCENGEEGVVSLLGDAVNGKPRVTKSAAVLASLLDFLHNITL